jgi:hypothetical protein
VVVAGRRSGKTEIGLKRDVVRKALESRRSDARFFCAAPTLAQAKALFWEDLNLLIPDNFKIRNSETDLTIELVHAEIVLIGLDKPEMMEGLPWDGGVIDEYADVHPRVWEDSIRPALADRQGWCTFLGVPPSEKFRGNHFFTLYEKAKWAPKGWEAFHWVSADILPESEIEAAKQVMGADDFAREFDAQWV